MRTWSGLRVFLSLLLALQIGLPAGTGAAGGQLRRDLQVEDLRSKATLWVLSVGVSKYADRRLNLRFADHDAVKIAAALQTQQGRLYREVLTQVLVNEQATREGILRSMTTFLGRASQDDVVLISLAGHGLQDGQTGTYYFLTYNARADNLITEGLSMSSFDEMAKRLRSNVSKLVLWLDTCHAGAMSVAARGVNVGRDLAAALAQSEGQYVLSASKGGEESYEDPGYRLEGEIKGHGAFSYSILRGLQGLASDKEGVVWLSDLFSHVTKEVPRLTEGKQHPHGDIVGTNMPLFVANEGVQQTADQAATTPLPPILGPPVPGKKASRKWLWLLAGVAVTGAGSAVLLKPSKSPEESTGGIAVIVQIP